MISPIQPFPAKPISPLPQIEDETACEMNDVIDESCKALLGIFAAIHQLNKQSTLPIALHLNQQISHS